MNQQDSDDNGECQITVRAPGKLILLGEYAVLEGGSALVTAVNCNASVQWDITGDSFLLQSSQLDSQIPIPFEVDIRGRVVFEKNLLPELDIRRLHFFKAAFSQGWKRMQERGEIPDFSNIKLDTTEFFNIDGMKMGFGSSAALTVSLLAAMLGTDDLGLLFQTAMAAHLEAQGRIGSGVDIAASTWGGVISYSPAWDKPCIRTMPEPGEKLFLVPVWTGHSASTTALVSRVYDFKKRETRAYSKIIDKMKQMSQAGIDAYHKGDIAAFLDIYHQYGMILHQLGDKSHTPIFNEAHLHLSEIVNRVGAVYKPSGAGGGDSGVAITDSFEIRQKLIDTLNGAGYTVLPVGTGAPGVHYE